MAYQQKSAEQRKAAVERVTAFMAKMDKGIEPTAILHYFKSIGCERIFIQIKADDVALSVEHPDWPQLLLVYTDTLDEACILALDHFLTAPKVPQATASAPRTLN